MFRSLSETAPERQVDSSADAGSEPSVNARPARKPGQAPGDNLKGLRLPVSPELTLVIGVRFIVTITVAIVFYISASETNSQWLYLLAAGLISAVALSVVYPIMQVMDLKLDVSLPPTARAGEKVPIKILLARILGIGNFTALFPIRWLRITVNVARLGTLGNVPLSKPLLIKTLSEKETFQLMAGPLRRGIYRVSSITIFSCFPFGLIWASRDVKFRFGNAARLENGEGDVYAGRQANPDGLASGASVDPANLADYAKSASYPEITVYPKVLPVAGSFLQKLRVVSPAVGLLSRQSNPFQQSSVVRGVREYQRGDSPRLIHWASSARLGRLLTREFEAEGLPQFDLLLDPKWDWGSEELYELALITAASLITLGYRWGLTPKMIVRNQVLVTEPPPLPPGLHASMELLARLEPFTRTEEISRVAARRGRRIDKLDDLIRKQKEGALIFLAPRVEKAQVEMVVVQPLGKTDADRPRQEPQVVDFKSEPDDIERVGTQISTVSSAEDVTRL